MNDYSRGYAAGLKAAAEVCRRGEQEQLDNLKIEPSNLTMNGIRIGHARDAEEILSLPIQGEATNPGEQVPDSARIAATDGTGADPARPGPCVVVPVEPTERILNAIAKQVNDCMMPKMIYQAMLAAALEEHDAHRRGSEEGSRSS